MMTERARRGRFGYDAPTSETRRRFPLQGRVSMQEPGAAVRQSRPAGGQTIQAPARSAPRLSPGQAFEVRARMRQSRSPTSPPWHGGTTYPSVRAPWHPAFSRPKGNPAFAGAGGPEAAEQGVRAPARLRSQVTGRSLERPAPPLQPRGPSPARLSVSGNRQSAVGSRDELNGPCRLPIADCRGVKPLSAPGQARRV